MQTSAQSLISNLHTPLVLTLDLGTSSLRAMLFNSHARVVDGVAAQVNYDMKTTPEGGVEADADELFAWTCGAIDTALAQAEARGIHQIDAVAVDSLVSNILGVDAEGRAITPVYTYADTRAARDVAELRARFDEHATHARVGTRFHTSYLPARFLWLAREHSDLFHRSTYWMSLGEYFYWRWLGARACTYSVASWTGLLNRQKLEWDAELIAGLPISIDQLSPLVDHDHPMRGLRDEFSTRWHALRDATWFPAVGDGAAANVGSGCVDASRIALTIGTSSAMRITVPPHPPAQIPDGLWSYRIDRAHELIGGALSEGGNLYAWMRDILQLDHSIEKELDAMEPDAHGLTVLPFLAGERAPGWIAEARAAILGLSLSTRRIDILRAGLESVAYRLALVYGLLKQAAPGARQVIASGGALMPSPTWTQMIADALGVPVIASAEPEATSRGAAVLALKALGIIESLEALPARMGRVYDPDPARHQTYRAAIKRQVKWYNLVVKRYNH